MMHHHRVTVLTCALCLATAVVWAQDHITEEDVLSTLNGKPRSAAPGHLLGVALHVTVSGQQAAGDREKHVLSGSNLPVDEALYKTLIPLARTLEAEVFRGARFVMKMVPTSSL